jgi:transposase
MRTLPAEVGIDVSKDWLDVCLEGEKPFRVTNSAKGLKELESRLPEGSQIHLEASGGYERKATRYLRERGWTVRVHDPLRAKRLGQALSGKAKTDAMDAKRLAELGRHLPSQVERTLQEETLRETARSAETLKTTAAEYKRRAKSPEIGENNRKAYLKAAAALAEIAKELEGEFDAEVKETSIGNRVRLARSVPGIGPVASRVLGCELPPDVEEIETAKVSSLVGIAPMDDSSGNRNGKKRIGQGSQWIKKVLYLSALSCIRSQQWAKELYAKLKAKGRAHRQAIVAVMRRLLVRVHAVLKRGTPWQDEPPNA